MILKNFLFLAATLFCIGVYGLITSRNIVRLLMSLELALNAININFIAFSNFIDIDERKGQVISLFIMALAAAEAAIGLALVLAIYRNRDTVDIEQFDVLKK